MNNTEQTQQIEVFLENFRPRFIFAAFSQRMQKKKRTAVAARTLAARVQQAKLIPKICGFQAYHF